MSVQRVEVVSVGRPGLQQLVGEIGTLEGKRNNEKTTAYRVKLSCLSEELRFVWLRAQDLRRVVEEEKVAS